MTKIEYSDALDSITNKDLIWIDIQKPTRKKLKMLEGKYPFHELNVEDSLSKIQRETCMGPSSGYLLHSIIDLMVDDLLHVLMKLEGNLDDIEDLVFDEKVAVARDISLLRREITTLRRVVVPLRRIILELSKEMQRFSEEDLTDYYDDVRDHTDKVLEVLEESKEIGRAHV